MAAEVSRQIKSEGKPITRDFLGGCSATESKELDLDLQVPVGWEKRLDLKSGKVYIQRCIQPSPHSSPKQSNLSNQTAPSSKMQDLNFPPHLLSSSSSSSKPRTTLSLFEETPLDLKLFPNSPSNALTNYNNATYQSVCTLDKVKSALDRAWRVSSPSSNSSSRKRPSPSNSASSSVISINATTTTDDSNSRPSPRDRNDSGVVFGMGSGSGLMVAGACPSCLLYVLISQNNPKCPKCNCAIPLPYGPKKPKIDLNISI